MGRVDSRTRTAGWAGVVPVAGALAAGLMVISGSLSVAAAELDAPPFEIDWSLALRGALVEGTTGSSYELQALPSASVTGVTLRGGYSVTLDAEISRRNENEVRLGSVTLGAEGSYQLDEVTSLEGGVELAISQDDADGGGFADTVAAAPVVVEGDATAQVTRDLGFLEVTLRGSVGRSVTGETLNEDNSTIDNEDRNVSTTGAGGRIAVRLTPAVKAFVDADARYDFYDVVSPSLLVKQDGVTYAARAGLSAEFGETLELQGSVGLGRRDFTEDTIEDFSAALYDASLTFRPSETLSVTGTLATTVSASQVEYAATAEARYLVSPWLRLRGSAGFDHAELAGSDDTDSGWQAGLGADYLFNRHTDLTADYRYSREGSSTGPETEEHWVALGVTFHR